MFDHDEQPLDSVSDADYAQINIKQGLEDESSYVLNTRRRRRRLASVYAVACVETQVSTRRLQGRATCLP